MKSFILARAKEPSTWRGLFLFLAAAGVPIAPHLAESIIATGLSVAGLIGVVAPDK